MPHTRGQRVKFYENHGRFAHYTTAEAALSIIKNKRIWMRNTTCMTDYREVQHGYEILHSFFSDQAKRGSFIEALDACCVDVAQDAITLFDQLWSNIRLSSYITSISEHDNDEDSHGRLSKWRAFGSNAPRVAIVFNAPWFSAGVAELKIMFSPVAYPTNDEVHKTMAGVTENIRTNSDFLRSVDRSILGQWVFNMLVTAVTCVKHEGFHEEREWRVIYSPKRSPSSLIEASTEVIAGIPQFIYKLPLDETVSSKLEDLDLSRMFDRLIIGPSPYPRVMYEAFVAALVQVRVAEANKHVFISDIPIRA